MNPYITPELVDLAVNTPFDDGALGRVGNQRFKGHDATPRTRRASSLKRGIVAFFKRLKYQRADGKRRATLWTLDAARKISGASGSCLGALTSPFECAVGRRVLASELSRLLCDAQALASSGERTGAQIYGPALKRHMARLGTTDLAALRHGLLSQPDRWESVLAGLDVKRHDAAYHLLVHIQAGLKAELSVRREVLVAEACAEPLRRMIGIFSGQDVDAAAMNLELERLSVSVGMLKSKDETLPSFLTPSLQGFSDEQLGDMARGLSSWADAQETASRSDLLNALHDAARQQVHLRGREAARRASEILLDVQRGTSSKSLYRDAYGSLDRAVSRLSGTCTTVSPRAAEWRDELLVIALQAVAPTQIERHLSAIDTDELATLKTRVQALRTAGTEQTPLELAIDTEYRTQLDHYQGKISEAVNRLNQDMAGDDRGAVSVQLARLGAVVVAIEGFLFVFKQPMPDHMRQDLKKAVNGALQRLRAPENAVGPLSRVSISRLSNAELGCLRLASDGLANYDLTIARDADKAEIAVRRQHEKASEAEQAAILMRVLADTAATASDTVKALRDVVQTALRQLRICSDLGVMMGSDDRADLACNLAQASIEAMAEKDADALRSAGNFDRYCGPLLRTLPSMRFALVDLADEEEPETQAAIRRMSPMLEYLIFFLQSLNGELMRKGAASQRQGTTADVSQTLPDDVLPQDLRAALAEEFGLDVIGKSSIVVPTITSRQRRILNTELSAPPTPRTAEIKTVELRLTSGETRSFDVSGQFAADGISRESIGLSIRGVNAEGKVVQYGNTWPTLTGLARSLAMADALQALEQLAGQSSIAITRIMNQQIGGGFLVALGQLNGDWPTKLTDGTPVMPGGDGVMDFDLERRPEGHFILNATVTFPSPRTALRQSGSAGMDGVRLDPNQSRVVLTVGLLLGPDGDIQGVAEPVDIRFRLIEAVRENSDA